MSLRRTLAVALTAAVLPVLLGSPAEASTWTHHDRVGDAQRITGSGDDEVVTPAPRNRTADVTRVDVAHSQKLVRITLHVRDLRAGNQFALSSLRHAGHGRAVAVLQREGGTTTFDLTTYTDEVCRGAAGRILPERDLVVMTIPRSCLGDPRWVRATALYATFEGPLDTTEAGFADDGLRTGEAEKSRSTWSPRVPVA